MIISNKTTQKVSSKSKKRILFLSPLPPPHYGSAMSSQICLDIIKDSKEFEVENIKLNYSKKIEDVGKVNTKKIKGILEVFNKIRKKINSFNPDIIYFMPATYKKGLIRDWLFVRKIKKIWKGKIIFHVRARILKKTKDNLLTKIILKNIFNKQKAIILGKELTVDLNGLIEKEDIFILPNAIPNEISEKKVQTAIKKRKEFNILFLSNMNESKGWLKLLKACKILKDKKINFNCTFVGPFPSKREERKFYSFIKENNLSNIKYLGKKVGKEKIRILKDSNVLVFPTDYELETFGRVIIEAMMAGLPVIANGIATIPTTIQNNKTGYVLKSNTAQEIADKIELLSKNPKLQIEMSKNARKRFLKKYELKRYKKNFLNILKKQ